MIRREPDLLHPRLTVVPVDGGSRPAIVPAPGRTVVGHAELAAAMEAVAERRRAVLRERIAGLDADHRAALDRLAEADAAVEQRRGDRDGFLAAAGWCESLPGEIAGLRAEVAAAEATLADRLRTSRDAARALDRVLEQRASADAAIAEARRQLEALRTASGDSPERQDAATQLAAQAASVEARLTEAEAEARATAERTKREVSEVERGIEAVARRQRDASARLGELVQCLPGEARPPHDDDPVHHVDAIAGGLRGLADVVAGELAGLQADADRQRAGCDELRRQVEAARMALERIAPEDAAQALSDLLAGVDDGVIVLDDVVAGGAAPEDGLLHALETSEPAAPLVLLSSDPTVLGWAIDLPADRGAIAGPRTVDLLTDQPATCTDPEPARLHALTTSPGDHR